MLNMRPAGPLAAAFWIDLCSPTPEEVASVEAATGMVVPSRDDLSGIETSSRLRVEGGVLYLSTPIVSKGDSAEPELTPMGFILAPRVLVTVRFAALRMVEGSTAEMACIETPSSVGVFTALLEAMVDRAADQLESGGAELDGLSRQTFRNADVAKKQVARAASSLRDTLSRLGRLGDRLGMIRASLLGVARIVPFASEVGKEWIKPEFHDRLVAVRADLLSLADYETHLEGKSQFLLDAVLGFISSEQADLFKILTIVSVVGVPPTLVASIYGMNFAYMPELHWKLGYPYALAAIVLSAVVPVLWFKWKDWW